MSVDERVAYISVSFIGHVSVLENLWKSDMNSHMFLLCFKDSVKESVKDIDFLKGETSRVTIIRWNCESPSENATVFNRERAKILTDFLHVRLYDFNPTTIVYDFFCLEASIVAKRLGIPAICSIPAMLKETETDTCSDGVLPKEDLYWLWKHPYTVSISPVQFMGPRSSAEKVDLGLKLDNKQRVIIVTFGSVVPFYSGCKKRLELILYQISLCANMMDDTTFVLVNLKKFVEENGIRFSKKTIILDFVDLVGIFNAYTPDLLIFHGGGNTYSEAYEKNIKMMVIPFFGDQFETLRRVGYEFTGIESIKSAFNRTTTVTTSSSKLLSKPFTDTFDLYFRVGDLVYGHRRHRSALQARFPQIDLHLEKYAPFHSFASLDDLPAIADVYNDDMHTIPNLDTEYGKRLREVNQVRQVNFRSHLPKEHRLVHYCLDILKLATTHWGSTIHFVLGPIEELGPATHIELKHIIQLLESKSNIKVICTI